MEKINDAFTFLFKEKNWAGKMLLAFIFAFIFSAASFFLSLPYNGTSDVNLRGPISYTQYTEANPVAIIASLCICLIFLPYVVINGWYLYESMQSGIQKRSTKALWEGNLGDKIKKSLKYLFVSFIYGLVIGIIVVAVFLILFFVYGLIIGSLGVVGSGFNSNQGTSIFSNPASLGLMGCIFFCCVTFLVLALFVAIYLLMMPGLLRLVATNTFSEAFKFGENWKLGMKYKGKFLGLLLVTLLSAILVGIIGGVLGAISGFTAFAAPLIGLILTFVVAYITTLINTYYTYFFFPRLSGLEFREIIENEPSLSYIQLEEK